jgi:hypothetical protein
LTYLNEYDEIVFFKRKDKMVFSIDRTERVPQAIIAAAASAAGRLAVLLGEAPI